MSGPAPKIDPQILEQVLRRSDARLLALALAVSAASAPVIDRRTN